VIACYVGAESMDRMMRHFRGDETEETPAATEEEKKGEGEGGAQAEGGEEAA